MKLQCCGAPSSQLLTRLTFFSFTNRPSFDWLRDTHRVPSCDTPCRPRNDRHTPFADSRSFLECIASFPFVPRDSPSSSWTHQCCWQRQAAWCWCSMFVDEKRLGGFCDQTWAITRTLLTSQFREFDPFHNFKALPVCKKIELGGYLKVVS
jgi:hypothetical protein